MSAAVIEAQRLANELIRFESRGAGDTENAMRRLANRYGLSWRVFWSLRYRPQKDVSVGVFEKLREAHAAECRRQLERMAHELQIAHLKGVHVQDLEDQVSALRSEFEACVAQRNQREG
jgi:hypothetical protein